MVQHLKETSGITTSDSTSNGNNGTKVSATEPNPTTSGQIGGAQDFDGSNDKITNPDIDLSTALTVELWFYADGVSWPAGFQSIIGKRDDATANFGVNVNGSIFQWYWKPSGTSYQIQSIASSSITTNSWHHFVGTLKQNGVNVDSQFFIDGSSQGTKTYNSLNLSDSVNNNNIYVSTYNGTGEPFDGKVDEVRISNTARSAAWIAASYKSETDAYNTFNTEEERYASSGTLTSSIFDTEQQSNWGTLTYNTDGVGTTAVKARTSNSSSMTGATDFASCNAITSGTDISSNNCVTDTHRYVQYQITLTSVSANSPIFQDTSIAFTASDSTAPTISLTALSPDPNSDTTPTLSGTTTEETGTVSNVQFQMDSTSSSWSSCSADDSSFDEATETFTCTPSALSDGSHTMYVRATDSNSNTTASGSESSDTFTIDTTAPAAFDLDSPGDNSYTNSERPTFKWKATTDATSGLSKYSIEIDNGDSGDFTIDNIPTSGTTDVTNNKYVIHFDGFSDSDSTNNYISVYTKPTNDWGSDNNDGKLKEGKRSWKVKAVDNAGNERSESRTLFVDRTNPSVEFTQINDTPLRQGYAGLSTSDRTPTILGKITDSLSGGDSSQTQDENGPRVASGPKQAEVKIEQKQGLTYKLHTLYTINMDKQYYTCDGKEVSDNSKQKCNKYLPFEYTSRENLGLGIYKITISGKDKADNSGGAQTTYLNIGTFKQVTTPEEKKIIEEKLKELKPEEKEKLMKELEVTKPTEPPKPGILEKTAAQAVNAAISIYWTIVAGVKTGLAFTSAAGLGLQHSSEAVLRQTALAWQAHQKFVAETNQKALQSAGNLSGQIVAFVGQGMQTTGKTVDEGLAFAGERVKGNTVRATQELLAGARRINSEIGGGYNQLTNNAPGAAKTILTGIGDGISTAASAIVSATNTAVNTASGMAQKTGQTIASTSKIIATTTTSITQNTVKGVEGATKTLSYAMSATVSGIGSTMKTVGGNAASSIGNGVNSTGKFAAQTARGLSDNLSAAAQTADRIVSPPAQKVTTFLAITAEYWFDKEPTKIVLVKVEEAAPNSAMIYWQTNHHATSTVNYGVDTSYGRKVQSNERVKEHYITLFDLEPGKTYFFEVMSQNKNYVYDAYYTFQTPSGKETAEGKVKGVTSNKGVFKKPQVKIIGSIGDWVLVRDSALKQAEVAAKVQVGQIFPLLEEKDGWWKIQIDGASGWIFSELGKLVEE